MRDVIVLMKDIHKVYPDGVYALRGVDFELRNGEIHGLLGENGAGKTTLMRILYGQIKPTSGEIFIKGNKVRFNRPRDAIKYGIGMVFQHFALVHAFNALENIALGMEPSKGGLLNLKEVEDRVRELMERTGLKVDLKVPISRLSVGMRQRVEILKLLYRKVDVLILDEPTSVLSPIEVKELFRTLSKLREKGKTIVLVTHKLREALSICDRITVLRRGKKVATVKAREVGPEDLAKMMVGREVLFRVGKLKGRTGKEVLKVSNLWVKGDLGTYAVKGLSFTVRGGEIFGIAGVEGNGQSELVEALFGLRKVERGSITFKGEDITNLSVKEIRDRGISLIPEDRLGRGLIADFTLTENAILGMHYKPPFSKGFRLNLEESKSFARDLIRKYEITALSEDVPVKFLSGGNQQRLIVARELSRGPTLLIAFQPTMGLDVSATEFVRNGLLRMKSEGRAVLLISSDLEEVVQLSDRMAVMYEGKFMGLGRPEEFSTEEIGLMMGGLELHEVKSGNS
ncbi:MAG: ABC transporter ATP-binding protein [Thermofilum sp. ex4484_15]|nr:MAG: ABC transporter ATP-binding protein [Thermofilum sp. ex4484_15]